MTKIISIHEKITSSEFTFLIQRASTIKYFIKFSGMLFDLKLAQTRVHEDIARQRLTLKALNYFLLSHGDQKVYSI